MQAILKTFAIVNKLDKKNDKKKIKKYQNDLACYESTKGQANK